MNILIAVFIGGGLGSVVRYSISLGLKKYESGFPFATLTANILACVVLGAAWMFFAKNSDYSQQTKLLIMTGFCGGFSTFSTFSLETLELIQNHQTTYAIIYVLSSILCCLMVLFGIYRIMQ